MNKDLFKLYNFLKKEGCLFESDLLLGMIKKASNVPTPNEAVDDILELNGISKKEIGLVPLGSEVEYRYNDHGVAKLTTIDFLEGDRVLCFSWSKKSIPILSEYSLENSLEGYSGGSKREKFFNFLEENRLMDAFGGFDNSIGNFFGGVDAVISNDVIAGRVKYIYLIPNDLEVNVLEEMNIEGVTVSDLIDFATDMVAVGASLGAAFLSGGTFLIPSIAAKLRLAGGVANLIGIFNNLYDKKYIEAIIGVFAFGLNIRNTTPLLRFYQKFIGRGRGSFPGRIPVKKIPKYFFDILSALLSAVILIGESLAGVIDKFIMEQLRPMFPNEMSEQEIYEKLSEKVSAGETNPLIIFSNAYYENSGASIIVEACKYIQSEIEKFIGL